MLKSHTSFGSIKVNQPVNSIKIALLAIPAIEKWLGFHSKTISQNKIQIEKFFSTISEKMTIEIKENETNHISWMCSFNSFIITILFKIDDYFISIELDCQEFSIYSFLQEFVYLFYRLKEYIDHGKISLPSFEYSNFDKTSIFVSIPINKPQAVIFSHLTEFHYLSQIFSKYPECDLEAFRYSWGWIDEGPSNLISWKKSSILIHDFIIDFNPIGYIKWEINENDEEKSILTLTHKDIDLDDEINQEAAYFSYKNGWMYFMAKIKDLVENSSFTIHFLDEIID